MKKLIIIVIFLLTFLGKVEAVLAFTYTTNGQTLTVTQQTNDLPSNNFWAVTADDENCSYTASRGHSQTAPTSQNTIVMQLVKKDSFLTNPSVPIGTDVGCIEVFWDDNNNFFDAMQNSLANPLFLNPVYNFPFSQYEINNVTTLAFIQLLTDFVGGLFMIIILAIGIIGSLWITYKLIRVLLRWFKKFI